MTDAAMDRAGRGPREVRALAELLGVSGAAVAQPLLQVVARNGELLLVRGTTAAQGVLFGLLVVGLPVAPAYGIEAVAALLRERARPVVHAVLCGAFVALFTIQAAAQVGLVGAAASGAALVAGAIGTAGIFRFASARRLLRYLALGPIVYLTLFLAFSPATDVLFGGGGDVAGATLVGSPRRVVFVAFDELPEVSLLDGAGAIDRELFPNFAELARGATWYRNQTAVAAFSQGAVPALLTGRYPSRIGATPTQEAYPQNIFTLLGGRYEMNVQESVTRLCPTNLCERLTGSGLPALVRDSFDLWRESLTARQGKIKFNDAGAWRSALPSAQRFIKSLTPTRAPRLDFLDLGLPHYPWRYLPTLQRNAYVPGDPPGESYLGLWPTKVGAAVARQRHLLQVQAVDTLLGRIVARLRTIRAYDEALVIVTADHGVAFTQGEPARNPSSRNLPSVMWTPLFVKLPGEQTGETVDRPVQSIDVLPTIAETLGVRIPWKVDGRPLASAPRSNGTRRLYPWIWLPTAKDLRPTAGRSFIAVEGDQGFRAVVKGRAAPAGGDPGLRIYRWGPFGGLVGRPVAGLVKDRPDQVTLRVPNMAMFSRLDPGAKWAPWTWNVGAGTGIRAGAQLAVALNGVVVAVSETVRDQRGAIAFSFTVPPKLTRPGQNSVSAYVIGGTRADPELNPVAVRE